ncbi:hypothetical protein VQ03_09655 [Methylobacterium tarhaniae]|uniref:Peptidase n=1 Tax=Methylobacterium tarhaniae TaxID=1187852 RepID=A0A0J6TBC3_9HYPH|nr:PepSY-associated TM helix domain-containing protein [Methylobacterium tarhaniae]KMO42938.1 hypothetical protein VQ03_09655 [Methylobacterium tarhaniae]
MRNVLFQVHWFLGLTAGLVLMVVGATGGVLSLEEEITGLLSPGIVTVPAREAPRLTPDALIARLRDDAPGQRVKRLVLSGAPDRAVQVHLTGDGSGRGSDTYVDPYDGRILGPARGEDVFGFVRRLHRWLVLPGDGDGWGRTITGASALALVYLALSGLYLRWPKGRRDWRIWLKPALNRRGRALYWSLHAVVGTWVLVLYLVMALTGLWWSYGWYRDGATLLLTGRPPAAPARDMGPRDRGTREGAPVRLDPAFAAFTAATNGRYATASLVPAREGETIRIRAVAPDADHFQARDEWRFHPDGTLASRDLYAGRPLGARLTGSMLALHQGHFFGPVGWITFMLAALAMPLFGVTGLLLYLGRRRSRRRHAAATVPAARQAA